MATKKHKLSTEIHPKGFMIITCPEGDYITSWKEGDGYTKYSATKIIYTAPKDNPEAIYRCITEAEHKKYSKLHDEALEEKRKKHEEELNNE